jgi:septal ring factor EnvC (AmiA/AmiB activator)
MDQTKSVIQKKFRIDDGRSKYMEQSTMLEPSNNQGGSKWEDEEEMREISQSLGKLKKKYDVVRKQALKMEQDLDLVRKEIKQLENQESQAEQTFYESSSRVE